MTLRHTSTPVTTDRDEAKRQRELELTKLIETSAYYANAWYGVSYLIVDRIGTPKETATIKALHNERMVDLWDLDPLLWDEAHWAATRLVEHGAAAVIKPVLHRG